MSEQLRRDLYNEYKCIKEEYGEIAAAEYAADCGADFRDFIAAECSAPTEEEFFPF